MIYNHSHNPGFSLVETLVAVTILLIVIVGPMTLAANATRSTNFSSEQVIATFLAQEGAELAQIARDNILLPRFAGTPGNAWTGFTDTAGAYADCFAAGCGLSIDDPTGTILVTNCAGGGCVLRRDIGANRSLYNYNTGTPTVYTRTVTMSETVAGREVRVVSQVTWRTDNQRQEQSVEVVTYLFNVYGR